MKKGDVVIITDCGSPMCSCIGKVGSISLLSKDGGVVISYNKKNLLCSTGTNLENVRLATPEEIRVFELLMNLGK